MQGISTRAAVTGSMIHKDRGMGSHTVPTMHRPPAIQTFPARRWVAYQFSSLWSVQGSLMPMVLLRPVSGGGSTALLTSLFEDCGPDSFAGRVASVLAGSSETTFYAIAMYFGCIKVKKIRHTLFAAIIADITAAVMSVLTVRLYFGIT